MRVVRQQADADEANGEQDTANSAEPGRLHLIG